MFYAFSGVFVILDDLRHVMSNEFLVNVRIKGQTADLSVSKI